MIQREDEIERKLSRPRLSKSQRFKAEVKSFLMSFNFILAVLLAVALYYVPDVIAFAVPVLQHKMEEMKPDPPPPAPPETTYLSYN
eukprot:UN02693